MALDDLPPDIQAKVLEITSDRRPYSRFLDSFCSGVALAMSQRNVRRSPAQTAAARDNGAGSEVEAELHRLH